METKPQATESPPDHTHQRGHLSRVAGAGFGTFFVAAIQAMELGRPAEHLLTLLAPLLAIGISAVGPFVQDIAVNYCRLRNARYWLAKAREFAKELKEGSRSHARSERNITEMEGIISDSFKRNLLRGTTLEFSRSLDDAARALQREVLALPDDPEPVSDPAKP